MTAARRWRVTVAALFLAALVGVTAFTTGLDREGFPPVDTPISVVTGEYFVDDPRRMDTELARPLERSFADVDGVVETLTEALPNSLGIVVEFESGVSSEEGTRRLEALEIAPPEGARVDYRPIDAAKFLGEYDALVSIIGPGDATPPDLEEQAELLDSYLEAEPAIESATVRRLITELGGPAGVGVERRITRFTRVALDGDRHQEAITLGLLRAEDSGLDVLGFSDLVQRRLDVGSNPVAEGYRSEITADFALGVRAQLNSLSRNLLTGLIVVALVSLLLIGWRVALITAGFMVLVLLGAMAGLWAIGYTLNTITLFGLILTLGLLVDDAVVISESVDANREDPDPTEDERSLGVIHRAVDRVGSASLAGTLTTVVVFSPLLFIGGILGEFIRPIPATVMMTLLISFTVALLFIPAIGRNFITAGRRRGPIARIDRHAARAMGRLARYPTVGGWAGRAVGAALVLLALASIATGIRVAGGLGFSIFPTGKDSTGIAVAAEFPPGTTIAEAQRISGQIDTAVEEVLGDELVRSLYVRGNERLIETNVELTAIDARDATAPQFVEEIELRAEEIEGARVTVSQVEAGPPVLEFPFAVQVVLGAQPTTEEVAAAQGLARDIRADIDGSRFEVGGDTVSIVDTLISTEGKVQRIDGERFIEVRAKYDDDDAVTSNLSATEERVRERFPSSLLAERGLPADALNYDFGFESDNQEDFAALQAAGLVALLLMLALVTLQFRSLAQSVLIFLAIPFSFLGVFASLALTDNPISFLVLVGFIALVGVAVNNTILLVDAANQARSSGATAGEAIREAVERRFRPLVATTATTVGGLLPLSLSDPFWESLGFTLIGGLISSTILVLLAFPAFYLALEAVRTPARNLVRRRRGQPEII